MNNFKILEIAQKSEPSFTKLKCGAASSKPGVKISQILPVALIHHPGFAVQGPLIQ
jgi:hypothetical protein